MRALTFTILLALTGALLAGEQKTAPVALAHIEGVVLDGASGKPLPEVIVTALQEADGRNAISDGQGHFSFDIPFGTVRVVTSKKDYGNIRPEGHNLPGGSAGVLLTTAAGQRLKDITLRMFPVGAIGGRVFDSRSKALTGAHAQLWNYTYDETGERVMRQVPGSRSGDVNDRGEFHITGIDPGDYLLKIEPPLMGERLPGEPYVPVYFPGTPDSAGATPLTVRSGPEMKLDDITMTTTRGGAIKVQLVNQTGIKVDNTMEKFMHWGRKGTPGSTARAPLLIMGGPEKIEIPVPLGIYDLTLGYVRKGSLIGVGRTTVSVSPFGVDTEVTVNKGAKLTGRIMLQPPTGQPKPLPGLRCDFTADDVDGFSATSASDGSLTAMNVLAAHYRMACATLPADAYISQIQQGDRDVLKDGVEVEGADTNLTVNISGPGAAVQGTVIDAKGQKIANAVVALVPDAPLRNAMYLYRTAATDQAGGYSIRAVVPGLYHVFAWQELSGAPYKNAEFMKKHENDGAVVKAEKAGKVTVDTTLLEP